MKNEKKTYVLILSQNFMKGHTNAGKPTFFNKQVESGVKKHTIRMNIHHWRHIENLVNAGEAVVSVRYWTGRPYFSPRQELILLEKLKVQEVMIGKQHEILVDKKALTESESKQLMLNDGLQEEDFKSWFPMGQTHQGVIVHFTDLRY